MVEQKGGVLTRTEAARGHPGGLEAFSWFPQKLVQVGVQQALVAYPSGGWRAHKEEQESRGFIE